MPGYVFLTMSFEKSPIALSWIGFPGYVAHVISNIVLVAMSFLALSCVNTREPIPGYGFLVMLCRKSDFNSYG
jgi:hypothetical protein